MAETNGTAATWGQSFTPADLERLEKMISAMPETPWVLCAPDGRVWQDADPRALLRVLAGAVAAAWPLCAPAPSHEVQALVVKEQTL